MDGKPTEPPPLPPVPVGRERRVAPRYDVVAQASLVAMQDTLLMPVRNISFGGAFLEGKPSDYPALRRGATMELTISGSEAGGRDEDVISFSGTGKVVRIDHGTERGQPPGFGVTFTPSDDGEQDKMSRLLLRLAGAPAPK